jgi:hypothetical protein
LLDNRPTAFAAQAVPHRKNRSSGDGHDDERILGAFVPPKEGPKKYRWFARRKGRGGELTGLDFLYQGI